MMCGSSNFKVMLGQSMGSALSIRCAVEWEPTFKALSLSVISLRAPLSLS